MLHNILFWSLFNGSQYAARLWYQYRLGDDTALELLALYNLTDAAHLAQLLTFAGGSA